MADAGSRPSGARSPRDRFLGRSPLSTVAAWGGLAGARLDLAQLAAVAHRAETEFVGVPGGIMDQTVVAMATEGYAVFLDTRSLAVEQVPFDPRAHALHLVVIDSGVRRRL